MAQLRLPLETHGVNAIMCGPDTELRSILLEGFRLLESAPEICSLIEKDIDWAAKEAKAGRLADRQWLHRRTACLFGGPERELAEPDPVNTDALTLGTGRKRMLDGEAVLVFLLCRGHLQSITTPDALDRLYDSMLISEYLEARSLSRPSRSTLWSYLDAISIETHRHIDQALVQHIISEGLDDMSEVAIDSFSVKADSSWPSDSGLLLKVLARAYALGMKMPDRFGVPGFGNGWFPTWLRQLKELDFRISCSVGKPNSQKAVAELYRAVLSTAGNILERLCRQLEALELVWAQAQFIPSKQARYEEQIGAIFDCLGQAVCICQYADERVFEGRSRPAAEKILSISDRTAAYIQKGGREAILGYKPQLLRTGNGFVTIMELLQGNPADSARLVPVIKAHVELTGVVPSCVTADDGYTSRAGREQLKEMGVDVVSFSGSKGKKLIDEAEWNDPAYVQARNARSAVESTIWVFRHNHNLYRFTRRALEAVELELCEKVLVYNLSRCALLRGRQAALGLQKAAA